MPPLSREFAVLAGAALGLCIGSFLNVAIHRLPLEAESIASPRRSYCPACRHTLSWRENLPLLSYALQRGRCRWCRAPISPRYPLVELLTAGLWALVVWKAPPGAWGLVLVQWIVLSGLLVATFVDFACFEIPDQVSLGGMLLAPLASLIVPELHQDSRLAQAFSIPGGPVERLPALASCAAGMAAGGGLLLAIGWVGKRLYGRDAMGLGDVKLLCAGGGFVGAGGALAALMIASVAASLAGVAGILRWAWLSSARARERGRHAGWKRALRVGRLCGRYVPFGPYLGIGIGIALLAWNDVAAWIGCGP